MKLKREISAPLYDAIQIKYESGLYRDAILTALFYLNQCILTKANFDSAEFPTPTSEAILKLFSGTEPSIKLNSMTTLGQVLEQIGFGQMLLGLHHGIKAPRIHAEEGWDDQKTANAIIVFVDYLLTRIQGEKM